MTLRYAPSRPENTVDGLWLQIVEAIDDGKHKLGEIVDLIRKPDESRGPVKCAIRSALSAIIERGLLCYTAGEYRLTSKGRDQLARSTSGRRHVGEPLADALATLNDPCPACADSGHVTGYGAGSADHCPCTSPSHTEA